MVRRRVHRLADDEYAKLARFRSALRRYLHFSKSAAARMGVTGQQYSALLAVRAGGGAGQMTINDLAREMLVKHNSAVGLVDRLVQQGLLVRRTAAEDARKVKLALTPKGARVLEHVAGSHREELGRVGERLRELLRQIAES